MSEFAQAVVTQGWLWAVSLMLMLLSASGNKYTWPLKSRLEIICATALAVGLFIVGMLVFAMVTSPSTAAMAAMDPVVPMP